MKLSLEELAEKVNGWCVAHAVSPANGQAGEQVSERTIRYYRTLGLVAGPGEGGLYGELQYLQLCALRLLQAKGLPLRRVRELLFGRDAATLRELLERGLAELRAEKSSPVMALRPGSEELWRMTTLDTEFILCSRSGRGITDEQRAAILRILNPAD